MSSHFGDGKVGFRLDSIVPRCILLEVGMELVIYHETHSLVSLPYSHNRATIIDLCASAETVVRVDLCTRLNLLIGCMDELMYS